VEVIMSISKKDIISSWRAGSAFKRDVRATKDPALENQKPSPSKKDTKKWCGGKVGREHKPAWRMSGKIYSSMAIFECEKCKKQMGWCCPWGKNECKCGLHGR
jgi:hypothetical protein